MRKQLVWLGVWTVLAVVGAVLATNLPAIGAQAPAKSAYKGVVTPIGPYSPGVGVSGTVYLSGQIGIDPATNQIVDGGTEAQLRPDDTPVNWTI